MNVHLIRLTAALVVCLPALGWCLPLSEYRAQKGDTLDLYVSGSSAQDNTLQRLFLLLCEPNSLDVYRTRSRDVRLFFCRMKSGSSALSEVPEGQKVAFHKSSISGSGSGVGPLIQRTPVDFLNVMDLRAQFDTRCPPNWGQIVNSQGYALAAKNLRTGQIISPPGVRPPSEDRVFVCRRVNTSGTQAAYEIFFLHQRCTPGVRPFVESGDNVFTGSVSSDVQSCL